MHPWLGTLECKPIDNGVTSITLATLHDTGLETACGHIFHPNKSWMVDYKWLISMIKGNKYSHGSSTWETAAEGHVLALEIIVS